MTTPDSTILQATGVRFAYSDRTVLDGVDVEVGSGEVFGLLGPNGSGKSTLLSLLTGSRRMTAGTVRLDGEECDPMSRRYRSAIGVVFQSPALDARLTARENLGLVATMYGLRGSAARAAVDHGLEVARLADRATSPVGELSGGMRRRLDIARALLPRPRLLFMDEPTTGLDQASFRALWEYLRGVNERDGVTIVVSTHRSDEAEACDRICILHRGNAVATATPRELCARFAADMVVLETTDPTSVAERVRAATGTEAQVFGNEVHVGADDGHALVPRIFEALPRGLVTSVGVRRPGLTDAYLELTGHSLEADEEQAA